METARTRRIDSGEPLLLFNPPLSGVVAYAVSTAVCDNPECPCTRMYLSIRAAAETSGDTVQIRGPGIEGAISADGSDLTLAEDLAGVFPTEIKEWLREKLTQEDHRGWLRERWRRMRGQVGDPAYPSAALPEGSEWMCSFSDVFPYDFDLTVVHDRRLYLADDQYCLEPGCDCDEVSVSFVDVSQGRGLGRARVSIRRPSAAKIEGPPLLGHLWNAFLEEHEGTVLRRRFKRMRTVAQSRAPSRVRDRDLPRVGRNAPCPCGSGEKFKRCCGRSASPVEQKAQHGR